MACALRMWIRFKFGPFDSQQRYMVNSHSPRTQMIDSLNTAGANKANEIFRHI